MSLIFRWCSLCRFFLLLPLLLLVSCGAPTKREFAEKSGLRLRIDQFIEETLALAADFSFESNPIELASPLSPPPSTENSLVVSHKELGSIDSSTPLTSAEYLSLGTASGMGRLLQSSYGSEPIEEDWSDRIEEVIGCRYLFVYWTPSYSPPEILDEKTYEGGAAKVVVSLYDRKTGRWVLRFQVSSMATDSVAAKAKKYQLKDHLIFEINELLRDGLLAQIYEQVETSTGGNIRPVETTAPDT